MAEKNESNYWSDVFVLAAKVIVANHPFFVISNQVYKFVEKKMEPEEKRYNITEYGDEAKKIRLYICCLAKMAKVDGTISLQEDRYIEYLLREKYKLENKDVEKLYAFCKEVADDEFDLDFYVMSYAESIKYECKEASNFIESLIAFAHHDGDYSLPERKAIKRAIDICRLPSDLHDQILYCEVIAQKINELPGPMFGSGFFINDKGFIITNDHVIGYRKNIKVRAYDKFKNADVIMRDKESDLCLLHIDVGSVSTPFCTKPILEGQAIFTYGYPEPRSMGYSPKLTKGVISSKFGAKDDAHRMQIDAAIQPGNSGGPVIDCDSGAIVGLVSSRLKKAQKANYAIKADRILSFLGKMEVLRKSVDISDNSPRDFTQIVEDVNKSTVQVISCK